MALTDQEIILSEKIEEEKFNIGISDAELLAQIDAWELESEEFYGFLKRVWEQNINYYKGVQTGVERIVGKQSRAVENRIWMATETTIPIATSRLPDIVVRTEDEDEQSQIDAADLQDVLGYHMERVQIQGMAERFIRDLLLKRYGVFNVYWDDKIDDVGLRVVDPRRIRVPKYGKTIDELAFIIEYLEVSYQQAEDFFGKEIAEELLKISTEKKEKRRKKNIEITQVSTNEYVCWRGGNKIIKKEKNPNYNFEDLEKNFFDKPQKPYIVKSLFETEESIIGETDYVQQVIPIQDNINIRKRQIENIVRKVANPPLLIDSDVMSEEEAANITNEEGLILYGKDAANGQKIRFETPGQVPQYLFSDLEFSRREFDNIWGVHSTTRGEREGRETLGGRQLLRQADLGRIDLVARQLERALDEVAEYWTQLIKLFYTEERSFSILGQDGLRFVKNFNGKKVGNVKPMVMAGSTLPKDELTIHNEAITLWQLGGIGVKTLYKMLRLPNMSEAIDDYIQTKSGALLQGGGGGSSPMLPPAATEPQPKGTMLPMEGQI